MGRASHIYLRRRKRKGELKNLGKRNMAMEVIPKYKIHSTHKRSRQTMETTSNFYILHIQQPTVTITCKN